MSERVEPYGRYVDLVYVAGPYTAPDVEGRSKNIAAAWALGCQVAALGAMPVIPHMNTAHMDVIQPWGWWIDATMELMLRCNAVLMMPNWQDSRGARGEHDKAKQIGIPVFYDVPSLAAWVAEGLKDREQYMEGACDASDVS